MKHVAQNLTKVMKSSLTVSRILNSRYDKTILTTLMMRPTKRRKATTATNQSFIKHSQEIDELLTSEKNCWNVIRFLVVAQHPQINGVKVNHQNCKRMFQNAQRTDDLGSWTRKKFHKSATYVEERNFTNLLLDPNKKTEKSESASFESIGNVGNLWGKRLKGFSQLYKWQEKKFNFLTTWSKKNLRQRKFVVGKARMRRSVAQWFTRVWKFIISCLF